MCEYIIVFVAWVYCVMVAIVYLGAIYISLKNPDNRPHCAQSILSLVLGLLLYAALWPLTCSVCLWSKVLDARTDARRGQCGDGREDAHEDGHEEDAHEDGHEDES